jgi:ferrochelatase
MRLTRAVLSRPKTAILMMNMGGPSTIPEVKPFLSNLFNDKDLIPLPFSQKYAAKYIVNKRYKKIEEHYTEIGGGSPIGKWTKQQERLKI